MDGNYGSLAFIATKTDILERDEVAKSLVCDDIDILPNCFQKLGDASIIECALARNQYTKNRIQSDFKEG